MRVPDRPSRLKVISIPKVRSKVWARRSRPASARGLLGQPARPSGNPSGAAPARSRSDALPDQVERRAMISRTRVATGSASMIPSRAALRLSP